METGLDIYGYLAEHDIAYDRHEHPPVYTCEEAAQYVTESPAAQTKNLFLRNKKGTAHYLLVVRADKSADLSALSNRLGAGRLSLASAERLYRHLGVEPGAVTLLALIQDPERRVQVLIDRDLWDERAWRCHPLINTATLVIAREGIERFLGAVGHDYQVVDIPCRPA